MKKLGRAENINCSSVQRVGALEQTATTITGHEAIYSQTAVYLIHNRVLLASCEAIDDRLVGDTGLATVGQSPAKTATFEHCGAETGAAGCDPELNQVQRAWPKLPQAIKAGILAMVRASA